MSLIKHFYNSSLFLNTHEAFSEFANLFLNDRNAGFTVICERSSDISSIRKYLFHTIKSLSGKNLSIIGGLSFYSVDQVGQQFCALLSNLQNDVKNIPSSLFKPYINRQKQEHIIQFILNLFHLSTQDTLPLSQQFLTLLDTPLPQDTSLVSALLQTLQFKKNKSYKDIPTTLLKQILASFQSVQAVFNRYSRFQTLINDFLLNEFWSIIEKNPTFVQFIVPKKILNDSILWIGSPEYKKNDSHFNFRPGEFSQNLIDDFITIILKLRKEFSQNTNFYHNHTVLNTKISEDEIKRSKQIKLYVAKSSRIFYQKAIQATQMQNKHLMTFSGEFDPHMYQSVLKNASGSYKLSQNDINTINQPDQRNFFQEEIEGQISKKYDNFIETASYIENSTKLNEIAKIYSLPIRQLSDADLKEMFDAYLKNETFFYKKSSHFENLKKSFCFFDTIQIPHSITSLWSRGYFEPSSLAMRVLNQLFAYLQTQGVEVENPYSESEFLYFWKHIVYLTKQFPNMEIQFLIENEEILEKFPIKFDKSQILPFTDDPAISHSKISNEIYEKNFLDTNISQFKNIFQKIDFKIVSTTQFECFIECPFKFFLEYILKLKPEKKENIFSVDPLEIGTKVHKVCEMLISGMVIRYGNDGYIQEALKLYTNVLTALAPENIFLSSKKSTWQKALENLEEFEKNLLFNIIDEIFHSSNTNEQGHLNQVLSEETLKRTFFKLLKTEIDLIKTGTKLRIGTAREYPFTINIATLSVSGRIDRIDLNQDGYEIIDYKVSPISKSTNSLCLLPSEYLIKKGNKKLSIQGAIYALAFGKYAFEKQISSQVDNENRLSAFSLYRLKNVKDDSALLSYSFNQNSSQSGYEQIKKIEHELESYARLFINKDFFPNPLNKKMTCQYCNFRNVCPYPVQQGYHYA